MRAVVVGTGTIGSAVSKSCKQDAHQVVTVGCKSGFRLTRTRLPPPCLKNPIILLFATNVKNVKKPRSKACVPVSVTRVRRKQRRPQNC
jgi:glycerol-3-phosphate dehydrogenase